LVEASPPLPETRDEPKKMEAGIKSKKLVRLMEPIKKKEGKIA